MAISVWKKSYVSIDIIYVRFRCFWRKEPEANKGTVSNRATWTLDAFYALCFRCTGVRLEKDVASNNQLNMSTNTTCRPTQ